MREKNDIRVFGWTDFKHPKFDLPGHLHGCQVRVIVAAKSRAAAMRAARHNPRASWARDFVSETGNETELRVARAKPGAVFMAPLDGPNRFDFVEVPEEFL